MEIQRRIRLTFRRITNTIANDVMKKYINKIQLNNMYLHYSVIRRNAQNTPNSEDYLKIRTLSIKY